MASQKKVLFVLTNHSKLGTSAELTGWYLPECAHPYYQFKSAGYDVDFCSPLGGPCPCDKSSLSYLASDQQCKDFWSDQGIQDRIKNSIPASSVDLSPYRAIFYVGGHGPMWDVVHCKSLADKVAMWYKGGLGAGQQTQMGQPSQAVAMGPRVIGAVCHGPAGLVNVALDSRPLVQGAKMTCFSNSEEASMKLSNVVPFLLESKLKERGAIVSPGPNMECCVVVDEGKRLVTGQNPASAGPCGQAIVRLLDKLSGQATGPGMGSAVSSKADMPSSSSSSAAAAGRAGGGRGGYTAEDSGVAGLPVGYHTDELGEMG